MVYMVFGVIAVIAGVTLVVQSVDALSILLTLAGIGLVFSGNARRKGKARKKQEIKQRNAIWTSSFKHTVGLPIAENVKCSLFLTDQGITIASPGTEFDIPKDRIRDVSVADETQIQKSYVSSTGGAIGGAVLFGPLGAMIGGRAKEKKTKIISHFLTITFTKGEELEYISFDVTDNLLDANKLVKLSPKPDVVQKVTL